MVQVTLMFSSYVCFGQFLFPLCCCQFLSLIFLRASVYLSLFHLVLMFYVLEKK